MVLSCAKIMTTSVSHNQTKIMTLGKKQKMSGAIALILFTF